MLVLELESEDRKICESIHTSEVRGGRMRMRIRQTCAA